MIMASRVCEGASAGQEGRCAAHRLRALAEVESGALMDSGQSACSALRRFDYWAPHFTLEG